MPMKAAIRKPFLLKMWEEHPKIWKFMIDVGLLTKYKTLNTAKIPNKIVLPSSNVLFVNANENRGRALLISNGVTQKRLTSFWCKAVEILEPDVTIDVGVNYGECIFSTSYPSEAKIYGVEANQELLKYIMQSKEAHVNSSQITICHAFVSDKDGEETQFYVDQHWSGTSSASYIPSHQMIEEVTVQSTTVDSLIKEDVTNKSVLFKIDVEGYEALVLKGMTRLVETSSKMIGFIEFNSEYIEKLGMTVDAFLSFLKSHFHLYIYQGR